MSGWNFYLLSFLPSLGDLGSAPPLSVAELLEHVEDNRAASEVLRAAVLEDELRQREAYLSGELKELDLAVLTPEQGRNEAPLPEYLAGQLEGGARAAAVDLTWEGYFRFAVDVARRESSSFFAAWLRREVALRNALAEARAKALQLDAQQYLVAGELADEDADFSQLLNEWSAAGSPLAGMQVLQRDRWNWLVEHEGWFSFKDDELLVYGVKLMVLRAWQEVAQAEEHKQETEVVQ